VPATAEIVIEGEIATDYLEPEGPFGEFTGYMGGQMVNGVFLVKCITHRKNPILQMFTEGVPSESGVMRKMGYESTLYKLLKYDCNIPTVMDVTLHESSGSGKYVVIRMKKTNPAQPWQALQAAVALDPSHGKILVTVDDDIDPEDADSVNWAISFACSRTVTSRSRPTSSPVWIVGGAPGSPVTGAISLASGCRRCDRCHAQVPILRWSRPKIYGSREGQMGKTRLAAAKDSGMVTAWDIGNEDEENAELAVQGIEKALPRLPRKGGETLIHAAAQGRWQVVICRDDGTRQMAKMNRRR
jgi:hypothetical protein